MLSDYEIVYLIGESTSNTAMMGMNVFSIVSAYLVVGFLIGQKLSRTVFVFFSTLFIMALIMGGFQLVKHLAIVGAMVEQLKLRNAETGSLIWHPSTHTPTNYMSAQPTVVTIAIIVIALASIWFFYKCHIGDAGRGVIT